MIIDESHNLRNRESKRYRAIREYIRSNESRCVLLSGTPYNKSLLDVSSQLRLFVDEEQDLGIRPERLINEIGDLEFRKLHPGGQRTLAAFERSFFAEDWRELVRLVHRSQTRTFIQSEYAKRDGTSDKPYLLFGDGSRFNFPERIPRNLTFDVDATNPRDIYARLQSEEVVNTIAALKLPRYGLGNYLVKGAENRATVQELQVIKGLSRAGKRLIGFCKTGLFKRLESEAHSFIRSVERHIVRNYVFLYAIENRLATSSWSAWHPTW